MFLFQMPVLLLQLGLSLGLAGLVGGYRSTLPLVGGFTTKGFTTSRSHSQGHVRGFSTTHRGFTGSGSTSEGWEALKPRGMGEGGHTLIGGGEEGGPVLESDGQGGRRDVTQEWPLRECIAILGQYNTLSHCHAAILSHFILGNSWSVENTSIM